MAAGVVVARSGRFSAWINLAGRQHRIGTFSSEDEAVQARREAESAKRENPPLRRKSVANSSGETGVSFDGERNRFRAYLYLNRAKITLGDYQTLRAARDARVKAELIHFGRRITE